MHQSVFSFCPVVAVSNDPSSHLCPGCNPVKSHVGLQNWGELKITQAYIMNNEFCGGNGSSAKNCVTLQELTPALIELYLKLTALLPYYLETEQLR